MSTRNYTVLQLLSVAHRSRTNFPSTIPGYDHDHVVELQLVVAALNRLRPNTYRAPNWQQTLVDFFNSHDNMQRLPSLINQTKGQAVRRFLRGLQLSPVDSWHIQLIKNKWIQLRSQLPNFLRFKEQLDCILGLEQSFSKPDTE